MLAYVLALIVGLSSVALYMAAFFFPEVHRKHDFAWSGVGLFYALVLWVCAGRITGGVLLGQTASIALLGWLGWQTLTLRRQVAPADQQTVAPSAVELQATLSQTLANLAKPETIAQFSKPLARQYARLRAWIEALVATTTQPPKPTPPVVEPDPYVPLTPADFANAGQSASSTADAIATEATPVPPPKAPSQAATPATPAPSIGQQIQDVFKGFTQKRESKPVYVRKQFRAPETEPAIAAVDVEASGDRSLEPPPPATDAPTTDSLTADSLKIESTEAAIVDAAASDLPVTPPSPTHPNASAEATHPE